MADTKEIWDNVKNNSQKVALSAVQKAMDLREMAQKKGQETMENIKNDRELKKARAILKEEYEILGKLSYEIEKGNLRRDDNVLAASLARIDRSRERIAELEKVE